MLVSRRLPHRTDENAITQAVTAARRAGTEIADLTATNPTAADLPYPHDLLAVLADARGLVYDPQPFGLYAAREAVAADYSRHGALVDPEAVALSASTSESYSWLFKCFCNAGDCVLAPQPSYPLFEHLTRLEAIELAPYHLRYHGRWEIDFDSVYDAPARTRMMLLVSPNNPTGTFVSAAELARAMSICRERDWVLVVDEVFADYSLEERDPVTVAAARANVLTITLGGASKSLGLPQVKLGWLIVGGPPAVRQTALDALALVADTYLSVGTPTQLAAPELLRRGAAVRGAIQARIRENLRLLREATGEYPSCDALRVDGGWTAPIRVPATRSEESIVLELLRRERVLVHPGYFFDFPHEAFIVVSLLPRPDIFGPALRRALQFVHS